MNDDDDDTGGGTLVIDPSAGGALPPGPGGRPVSSGQPAYPQDPYGSQGYGQQPYMNPAYGPPPDYQNPQPSAPQQSYPYPQDHAQQPHYSAPQPGVDASGLHRPPSMPPLATQVLSLPEGPMDPAQYQAMIDARLRGEPQQPRTPYSQGPDPGLPPSAYTMPLPSEQAQQMSSWPMPLPGQAQDPNAQYGSGAQAAYGAQGAAQQGQWQQPDPYAGQGSVPPAPQMGSGSMGYGAPEGAPPDPFYRESGANARPSSTAMRLADAPTDITRKKSGGLMLGIGIGVFVLVMGVGIAGTLFIMNRRAATPEPQASSTSSAGAATPTSTETVAVAPTTDATQTAPATATTPPDPSSASTTPTTPPSATDTAPVPTATATATSTTPAPAADPTAQAIAALEKLKTAIDECVKKTTHVLPASSPAVPSSLFVFKRGPYQPTARDWTGPFFSCAAFKIEEPMGFMIQWQLEEPSWRGSGVAWIDSNADGTADSAYAFNANLKQKDEVEYSAVKSIEPDRRLKFGR